MPLIVAIEPDRGQAARLAAVVRARIENAELVIAAASAAALERLGDRVPDVILTSPLLSPRDEAALAGRLRELGDRAARVPTLTIPVLGDLEPAAQPRQKRGLLSVLKRSKPAPAPAADVGGCDPLVFADEITAYLGKPSLDQIAERQRLEAEARLADEQRLVGSPGTELEFAL